MKEITHLAWRDSFDMYHWSFKKKSLQYLKTDLNYKAFHFTGYELKCSHILDEVVVWFFLMYNFTRESITKEKNVPQFSYKS